MTKCDMLMDAMTAMDCTEDFARIDEISSREKILVSYAAFRKGAIKFRREGSIVAAKFCEAHCDRIYDGVVRVFTTLQNN